MFKKSYKGRRIKFAAKKSLAVPVAIVTSFIVILVVSLSPLVNKGLVNAFSDSVIPTPSTTSTTSESTADLVKSTEVSSIKENKEKVEESKAQSETMTETVGASEKPQSESATTASIDATFTQNNGAASSVAASTTGNGSVIISNGNTAGEIGSYAAAQKKVEEAYKDEKGWARMAMLNTACAGKFTSDRTIQEYVDDIWHLDKVFVK